jgi:hypothetical protein
MSASHLQDVATFIPHNFKFWALNQKKIHHLSELHTDGRVILKWILIEVGCEAV